MSDYCTQVLIVGGGLAALRAAIEAAQHAQVMLVVKGKPGRSGSSAMTTAGYAATLPPQTDYSSHAADTIAGGYGLNEPALVEALAREAFPRLQDLESYGAPINKTESGAYLTSPSGDHSVDRVVSPTHHVGTDFTVPMVERALALGVEVLDYHMAIELLLSDGSITGAIVLNMRTGHLATVSARAVVLATGGAGQLYSVTSNPAGTTGDGFALAFRAGATLRDMEMIQFYPWRCIHPFSRSRMPFQPSTFVVGGKLYNKLGERFMARYNPHGLEACTRDVAARAIYDQIQTGNDINGGVRLDLSDVDEPTFKATNVKVWTALQQTDIDYRTYPFILAPEAHYIMGGVAIDVRGATTVKGLFAAGEVSGGIQGANRLNSNALPEAQVFGQRAGRDAAQFAQDVGYESPSAGALQPWESALAGVAAGRGSSLKDERRRLREVAWTTLGIVRSEETLAAGLTYIRELRHRLQSIAPASPAEAVDWVELGNLCDFGELACLSALTRTESRGAHFRSDFPERDDRSWQKSVLVKLGQAGEVEISTAPPGSLAVTAVAS